MDAVNTMDYSTAWTHNYILELSSKLLLAKGQGCLSHFSKERLGNLVNEIYCSWFYSPSQSGMLSLQQTFKIDAFFDSDSLVSNEYKQIQNGVKKLRSLK